MIRSIITFVRSLLDYKIALKDFVFGSFLPVDIEIVEECETLAVHRGYQRETPGLWVLLRLGPPFTSAGALVAFRFHFQTS